MALTIGPRLQGFFEEVLPAIITTLNDRGAPEMTPLWYEYAAGQILLNGDRTRIWMDRMRKTGRATVFVMDRDNFWRWVQVYGRVVDISDDPGGDHINRLAHRYRGADYSGDRSTRRTVRIEITSVKGADGSPRDKWDVTG
jgi:PPOX class probable F420-dependent enzyme